MGRLVISSLVAQVSQCNIILYTHPNTVNFLRTSWFLQNENRHGNVSERPFGSARTDGIYLNPSAIVAPNPPILSTIPVLTSLFLYF